MDIVVQQAEDEVIAVLSPKIGVRRIAQDDKDRTVAFDGRNFVGFLGQSGQRAGLVRDVLNAFKSVGEVDVDALVSLELIGPGGPPEFGQMATA